MRINKYLADKQYASRRGADELIREGLVFINGEPAKLGDTVTEKDTIEVKNTANKQGLNNKELVYFAYNKSIGVVTHSPQAEEKDIRQEMVAGLKSSPLTKGINPTSLFPIGRLDKDSHGLIILTNDGRITGKLLSPDEAHEK